MTMDKLKRLVNDPELHEAFLAYLHRKIGAEQKVLEQTTKMEDIYRSQGKILALRRLLSLREEVNINYVG